MPIDEWNQREVIDQVGDLLEGRMGAATQIVENDARRNLLNIRAPDIYPGRAYRWYLATFELTSRVERDKKSITGYIGIPKGREGDRYGFYIETGSSEAPPHPWLRPALLDNAQKIRKVLTG